LKDVEGRGGQKKLKNRTEPKKKTYKQYTNNFETGLKQFSSVQYSSVLFETVRNSSVR